MGVTLSRRGRIYWLTISTRGHRLRFSLHTRDAGVARTAKQVYEKRLAASEPLFGSHSESTITVKAFALDWIERKARSRRASTVSGYRTAVHEILPVIGTMPMTEVTRLDARRVAEVLAAGGRGKRRIETVKRLLAYLQSLFSDASDEILNARGQKLIATNPFERKGRLVEELEKERAALGGDEVDDAPNPYMIEATDRIIKVARGDLADYVKILFGLDAGLRRSELLALHYDDLNPEGAWGQVCRRISRGEIGPPKSAKSRRRFPLTDRLMDAVRQLRTQQMRLALRRGSNEPPAVLFPPRKRRADGCGYEDEKRFSQRFSRILEAAEVERRIHPFHCLRHTFVSRLLESGVGPYLVSKWVGHRSTEFTQRVYASWIPGDDHREKINRPLRHNPPQSSHSGEGESE